MSQALIANYEELLRIARLVRARRTLELVECGCCGRYHFPQYHGDCRNDAEWFGGFDPFEDILTDIDKLLNSES